jgi:hypothetical protein
MIPWSALVRHAPALLAAADTLLARARTSRPGGGPQDGAARLHKLEQSAAESAQLLHDMAAQVSALTEMQERTAKRARLAVGLAIGAIVLSAAALLVAALT